MYLTHSVDLAGGKVSIIALVLGVPYWRVGRQPCPLPRVPHLQAPLGLGE